MHSTFHFTNKVMTYISNDIITTLRKRKLNLKTITLHTHILVIPIYYLHENLLIHIFITNL